MEHLTHDIDFKSHTCNVSITPQRRNWPEVANPANHPPCSKIETDVTGLDCLIKEFQQGFTVNLGKFFGK